MEAQLRPVRRRPPRWSCLNPACAPS